MAKLRVHNIEPSTGTDVAFGTTGDTIAVSSDSLKLNTWKDSGGNTLFQSDGAGTLSNVNSTFSGAGPKLILSQTADASSSLSFTSDIDSTYDKYMFVFTNISTSGDNVMFSFQVNASGETGYNEAMTTTTFVARHYENDTTANLEYDTGPDQANGTSYQAIMTSIGNEADESASGILYLFAPASTTFVKNFYSTTSNLTYHPAEFNLFVSGYINTTSAITAIDFKPHLGTFDGKITMYGIS